MNHTVRNTILVGTGVVACVATIMGIIALREVQHQERRLVDDLIMRGRLLAETLSARTGPYIAAQEIHAARREFDRFVRHERIDAALFDTQGSIASSTNSGPALRVLTHTMDDAVYAHFISDATHRLVVAVPIREDAVVVGSAAVIIPADYLVSGTSRIRQAAFARIIIELMVGITAAAFFIRWLFITPVAALTASVQAARVGDTIPSHDTGITKFIQPLAREVALVLRGLREARTAAREEARLRLRRDDAPWTAERLRVFVESRLKGKSLFVVSHREPYIHERDGQSVRVSIPPSGLVTALDALLRACGGEWIAYGGGSADYQTADAEGKIRVPPDEPRYTLRRVAIVAEDEERFYNGFSNEALWPLCHLSHTRPVFRADDWAAYRKVNGQFAEAVLAAMKESQNPIVLVQDFHLALLPRLIKRARPDAHVGIFWHIPWPSPEQFSICPYRAELLDGILGADVIGFHTDLYGNNFLDTVRLELESKVNREDDSVEREGHISYVESFPISVAFSGRSPTVAASAEHILEALGVASPLIGLGVDRLDYTKGLLERFKAIEFLLSAHPELRHQFTFIQIAPGSREGVAKYRAYAAEVADEVRRINERFAQGRWKPIIFEKRPYTHDALGALYARADVCAVTSLSDGMNLVAKEYVAARDDMLGALVLSQFAGAAADLEGALVINPYSAEETAHALYLALSMPKSEQRVRMKSMRDSIQRYNVYRWAAEFLRAVAGLG